MWAWRRIPNLTSHRRPPIPLAASRCRYTPPLPSSSLKGCNVNCEDFLPWLQQKSGQEISSSLSIGSSIHGRTLFASKSIEYGEFMLKVPFSVQLTSDNARPEIQAILNSDANLSNIGQLAMVLLGEKKLGKVSEWAPYVAILPICEEMHNTIFWNEEELQMLQPSSVYHDSLRQKAHIEAEFAIINPVLGEYPHIFGDYSLEDFVHAYTVVQSRAWDTSKGISLIPFADFLNHDGTSNSVLICDEKEKVSEVMAHQNYASGDQVWIRYGKFSNATLLLQFGFTLPHNVHEQVQICLSVPEGDHLHVEKATLLQEHKLLMNIDALASSGSHFTIKEVRSSKGNGNGIPQPLRAFCRVVTATSAEELKSMAVEAVEGDGRLARCPLSNMDHEFRAHLLLHSHITRLIEDYNTSMRSTCMDPTSNSRHFYLRRRMAMNLLSGELRVLESAQSWLQNYCDNLST